MRNYGYPKVRCSQCGKKKSKLEEVGMGKFGLVKIKVCPTCLKKWEVKDVTKR